MYVWKSQPDWYWSLPSLPSALSQKEHEEVESEYYGLAGGELFLYWINGSGHSVIGKIWSLHGTAIGSMCLLPYSLNSLQQ